MFPDSWYAAGTTQNQMLTVPACARCSLEVLGGRGRPARRVTTWSTGCRQVWQIALELGCCERTVERHVRRFGVYRGMSIAELHVIEFEEPALQDEPGGPAKQAP